MFSPKKIIMSLIFSSILYGCSSSTIVKTLYTNGTFKYRATETETEDGYVVLGGLFVTNTTGNYTLSFVFSCQKYANPITISSEGDYFVTAKDDKNGAVTINGELAIEAETEDFSIDISITDISYVNYYFMYFSFASIGKICFVR